tara:strand:- start:4082 stop:6217 length:2136 start_codon:yes stop_codon:yes gene_type:complete
MMRWVFCFLAVTYGTVIYGAPAVVRSGDHPEFVRLVVDIPVGSDWKVGRVADGYAVQVEGVSEFDTSGVFSRISTARIRSLKNEQEQSRLVLFSDCDCNATAFLWKPDKLVIDINDGPARPDSKFEEVLDREVEEPTRPILPILTDVRPLAMRPEVRPIPIVDFASALENRTELNALEQVIVESLARGATQGLLAPSDNLQLSRAVPAQLDSHFARNEPGLLTRTSIDLGAERATTDINMPETCLPESYFAVGNWADGPPYAERTAQARARIAGEFDRIDPSAVVQLAKSYIVFGFGREARNALKIDGENSQEREILSVMGAIIDGDLIEPDGLSAQLGCSGPAALWALLAQNRPTKVEIDRNGILREFRALPAQLRNHLGPKLSNRFRARGDFEAAEMVISNKVNGSDTTFEAAIAQTELLSEMGKTDEAAEAFAFLAATDSRMTPSALIDYLTLAVETDANIDSEAIALGDILRFESKGGEIVGELAVAQVRAHIAVDDLRAAFRLLSDEAGAIGNERVDELTSGAVIAATTRYEDTAFLELAFSTTLESVSPEAENAVAARLLTLGLPERAMEIIGGQAVGSAMMERRYLRSSAALEIGDAEAAIDELLGLSTERAEKIRGQAELVLAGQDTISAVAQGDDWKLGNWTTLARGDDALLQDVSRSVLSEVNIPTDGEQPLADGRRLLAQSADMRNLLDEILLRFVAVPE